MTSAKQPKTMEKWLEEASGGAEVIPLDSGRLTDDRLDVEVEASDEQKDWNSAKNWLILLLVAVVVGLLAWLGFSARSDQAPPVQEAAVNTQLANELEAVQKQLKQAPSPAEVDQLREDNAKLESQLQTTLDEINIQVGVVEQLTEEKVEAELRAETEFNRAELATDEVLRQVEVVEQREAQLREAEALQTETEAQLDKARVQASTEAARASQARASLATAEALVPVRAEATLKLLRGAGLSTRVYELGTVPYLLRRPGPLDDETQFLGDATGKVGYINSLDKASVEWLDADVLQVILPLPIIEPAREIVVQGTFWTERQQFARIGGRWGEQTEPVVYDEARAKARELACGDVGALRESLSKLREMVFQLGRGYTVNVLWLSSDGKIRSTVSDAQLLDNAC